MRQVAQHILRAAPGIAEGPRRLVRAALLPLALWAWLAEPAHAQDGGYQTAGSVAAYLGLVPAEIVQGYAPGEPEARMHGGPPERRHAEHIVVALFDSGSGERIEDASVNARIVSHGGLDPLEIALEPMVTAGVTTFGGFVTFPGKGSYSIELEIRAAGDAAPTAITFEIEHGAG